MGSTRREPTAGAEGEPSGALQPSERSGGHMLFSICVFQSVLRTHVRLYLALF